MIATESSPAEDAPAVLIVMGVSGSGKSTIGALLASRLGWVFADADQFHPPANIEKMSNGIPLTDEDRWPWLEAMAAWIDETRHAKGHGVIACSALKRSYRDVLIGDRRDVRLIYLRGEEALIADRMAARCASTLASVALRIKAISPASFVTRSSARTALPSRKDV